MSANPITKTELLQAIRDAHARWQTLLSEIPEPWMVLPGAAGEWSVKDVIAHMAWGHRENLGVIRARALVGSELWQLSEDERNAAVFEQNRTRSLPDVQAEYHQVFQEYLEAIESLSEADLNDPSRFDLMPREWRPWRILYDPTHYEHHMQSIRVWLQAREGRVEDGLRH
jgi:hypothetical protein